MSDRQCNLCSLKSIKKKRKGTGVRILQRLDTGKMHGTNIYAVPKGEKLDHDKHFIAWFMEIPNHCCC